MANVKNYGLKGIGNDVQFGKAGGRLIYDTSSSFFKFTTDGSTLSQARVATTPSNSNDAASKAYVDSTASGLDVKNSVRAATTGNGTLASAYANGQTIDGVSLATGDRILLKDQTDASENGIYTVNASGAPTRATDFDSDAEVTSGAFAFIEEGTVNADNGFVLSTNGSITVGTTNLAFTQFSGGGAITAGSGMTKSGNTINVIGGDGITAGADDISIDIAASSALNIVGGALDVTIDLSDSTNDVTGTLAIANGGSGQTSMDDILAGSNKLTITNGAGTVIGGDATIDIAESNLDLANMGGTADLTSQVTGVLPVANGGTGGANAGAARTALGLAIGSDVQAYDAQLASIAGLSDADGKFIVGSASGFVAEDGDTARISLGVGSSDTPTFAGQTLTGDLAMGNNNITGLATPSNNTDAATKAYVDTASSTVSSTIAGDSGSAALTLGSDTFTVGGTSGVITTAMSGTTLTVDIADNPTLTGNATITGNLTVQGTTTTVNSTTVNVQNSFTFEGATPDEFETTLTVTDPTADRTLTLPDATDTIVGRATTDTLTNKTIAFGSNTFTGTLPVANGGLGADLSSIAVGTILVGGASNSIAELTIGTVNKVARSTGTTVQYDYVNTLRETTSGNSIFEVDQANIADNTKVLVSNTSGEVKLTSVDPDDNTANVNLVLEASGDGGKVIIRDNSGGASIILGDDDTTMTVSGGAASGGAAGDLVVKGGNGTGSHASGDAIIKGGTGGSAEGKVKITDTSDNEIMLFEKTASAVNEFSVTNAATGSNPNMAATGDDTNISIAMTPKGNGLIVVPNGYESNVGSVDDALVTRKWVIDNSVSDVDDLTIRAAVTNGAASASIGTMPNAGSTTYYVTNVRINVSSGYTGGSIDSFIINDGTTDLVAVADSDITTAGSYVVELDGATATAGGATLTASFKQQDGSTASTPTGGAMTVFVEYKAVA
jgi:hypothetical protein